LESTSDAHEVAASRWPSLFQISKYIIATILLVNILFYLMEDLTAFLYLDPGASLGDVVQSFSTTIDYVAWMILIVLFEMGTSAHARGALHGVRNWVIAGLTAVCYGVLVYATYGYTVDLVDTYHYEPIASETVCDLVEKNFAYMASDNRPVELSARNCGGFAGQRMYRSPSDHLIAAHANLMAIQKLGWVDVVNAVTWLLVVLIFQIEISLKQLDKLTKFRLALCTAIKVFLYLVLTGDAIYWTIYSAFIDYWDAWIWLAAFVLIDLNLLGVDDATGNPEADQPAAAG
jgi:hypothetical protein